VNTAIWAATLVLVVILTLAVAELMVALIVAIARQGSWDQAALPRAGCAGGICLLVTSDRFGTRQAYRAVKE
jgi:hypothetical protein